MSPPAAAAGAVWAKAEEMNMKTPQKGQFGFFIAGRMSSLRTKPPLYAAL
jgi:hypothetical protein